MISLPPSLIISLLLHRSPPTISWFIISVIVYTVNGQIIDITIIQSPFSKRGIVISPFFANSYSSTSPIRIIFTIRVVTSLLHSMPNTIQSFISTAMNGSVHTRVRFQPNAFLTTATFRLAFEQFVRRYDCLISARTTTPPIPAFTMFNTYDR